MYQLYKEQCTGFHRIPNIRRLFFHFGNFHSALFIKTTDASDRENFSSMILFVKSVFLPYIDAEFKIKMKLKDNFLR